MSLAYECRKRPRFLKINDFFTNGQRAKQIQPSKCATVHQNISVWKFNESPAWDIAKDPQEYKSRLCLRSQRPIPRHRTTPPSSAQHWPAETNRSGDSQSATGSRFRLEVWNIPKWLVKTSEYLATLPWIFLLDSGYLNAEVTHFCRAAI